MSGQLFLSTNLGARSSGDRLRSSGIRDRTAFCDHVVDFFDLFRLLRLGEAVAHVVARNGFRFVAHVAIVLCAGQQRAFGYPAAFKTI